MLKTYWDLSERERAALDTSDVERFVDAELMTKGVLKVPPLVLEPEPPEPTLAKRLFYRIGQLAFETEAQAVEFLKLSPRKVATTYLGGDYRHSLDYVEAPKDTAIELCQMAHEDDVKVARSALERLGTVRKENTARSEEHAKLSREQETTLEDMRDDWRSCRAKDRQNRKVVETFEQYRSLADGDAKVAARFLLKPFTREQIAEAAEWCGVSIPLPIIDEQFPEVPPARPCTSPTRLRSEP